MNNSIFIKTCLRDIEWLKYCLRSIAKFCSGFDEIVIVAPEHERQHFDKFGFTVERIVFQKEITRDGYTWQQIVKLNADQYTSAKRILFVDSDCVFFMPVTPEYFLKDGKPYLLYTAYSSLGDSVPWKKGTEYVMGQPIEYEFMRRHPMMHNRDTLIDFREFILDHFRIPCREFMLRNCHKRSISEFNVLGAYAYAFKRHDYIWYDTENDQYPASCLHQFWSYGGTTGEMNKEKLSELSSIIQ